MSAGFMPKLGLVFGPKLLQIGTVRSDNGIKVSVIRVCVAQTSISGDTALIKDSHRAMSNIQSKLHADICHFQHAVR